jgi:quinol-cytochrome oxidoreductase complex cytochrome b subunit
VGESIVTWLWGGFSVDNATLNRFFSLHYLMPFVIFALVFLHLVALHATKSNNPLGIDVKGPQDTLPFTPYYTVKDLFGLGVFLIIYLGFVFFAPNFFGEPDNYIKANPLVTPAHIVPEWYFLPYYAILRSFTFNILFIDAKLAGVLAMFGSILILFLLDLRATLITLTALVSRRIALRNSLPTWSIGALPECLNLTSGVVVFLVDHDNCICNNCKRNNRAGRLTF